MHFRDPCMGGLEHSVTFIGVKQRTAPSCLLSYSQPGGHVHLPAKEALGLVSTSAHQEGSPQNCSATTLGSKWPSTVVVPSCTCLCLMSPSAHLRQCSVVQGHNPVLSSLQLLKGERALAFVKLLIGFGRE